MFRVDKDLRPRQHPVDMRREFKGHRLTGRHVREVVNVFVADPIWPDRSCGGIVDPRDTLGGKEFRGALNPRGDIGRHGPKPGKPAGWIDCQGPELIRSVKPAGDKMMGLFVKQAMIAVGRITVWRHW